MSQAQKLNLLDSRLDTYVDSGRMKTWKEQLNLRQVQNAISEEDTMNDQYISHQKLWINWVVRLMKHHWPLSYL